MEQLGFDAVDDGRPQEPLQDGTTKSKISNAATSLGDGELIDIITNSPVKDTPKEQVRQWVARALWHEYGIRFADMERDFPLAVHSEGDDGAPRSLISRSLSRMRSTLSRTCTASWSANPSRSPAVR